MPGEVALPYPGHDSVSQAENLLWSLGPILEDVKWLFVLESASEETGLR